LKPNGVLAVGAFDDLGVETPVELSKEQQEHIVAAQQRFCQVCHRLIIYTDTKASIRVLLRVPVITWGWKNQSTSLRMIWEQQAHIVAAQERFFQV
jgi:hypothetical protein